MVKQQYSNCEGYEHSIHQYGHSIHQYPSIKYYVCEEFWYSWLSVPFKENILMSTSKNINYVTDETISSSKLIINAKVDDPIFLPEPTKKQLIATFTRRAWGLAYIWLPTCLILVIDSMEWFIKSYRSASSGFVWPYYHHHSLMANVLKPKRIDRKNKGNDLARFGQKFRWDLF